MAASFVGASSQRLVCSSPGVIDYPITIAAWVNYPVVVNNMTLWSLSDTATANNYLRVFTSTGSARWSLGTAAGGAEGIATIASSMVANTWQFVLARLISSTNRRLNVLTGSGSIVTTSTSTALAPSGMDTMALGSLENSAPADFYTGMVAEYWCATADVNIDGTNNTNDALMRQVAYGGPFSLPHLAKDIIEYRSLRKYPSSEGDQVGEVLHGALGRQTWSNTNGVTTASHPPLPYWYVKPNQNQRALVI